ncbi:MAG: response regulator, partial [bacterium]|nr:response regulator [bacterium]
MVAPEGVDLGLEETELDAHGFLQRRRTVPPAQREADLIALAQRDAVLEREAGQRTAVDGGELVADLTVGRGGVQQQLRRKQRQRLGEDPRLVAGGLDAGESVAAQGVQGDAVQALVAAPEAAAHPVLDSARGGVDSQFVTGVDQAGRLDESVAIRPRDERRAERPLEAAAIEGVRKLGVDRRDEVVEGGRWRRVIAPHHPEEADVVPFVGKYRHSVELHQGRVGWIGLKQQFGRGPAARVIAREDGDAAVAVAGPRSESVALRVAVVEAVDGLSGIQMARTEKPDLILMDINIPGIDGHEATTRIKSLPELSSIPIVALT